MESSLEALLERFSKAHPRLGGRIGGVTAAGRALVVATVAKQRAEGPLLCLTASRSEADRLVDDLNLLLPDPPALSSPEDRYASPYARLFPETEMSLFDQGESDPDRLQVLADLGGRQPVVVVAPLLAFLQPVASVQRLLRQRLKVGDRVERARFIESLASRGYQEADLVVGPGQFCQHSQIIDLYPSNGSPRRIELDAETIVSLRSFSPETQLTTANLESFDILSMREPTRDAHLVEHFSAEDPVLLVGEADLRARLEQMGDAAGEGWKFSTYQDLDILQNEDPDDWGELEAMLGERPRISLVAKPQEESELNLELQPAPSFEGLGGLVQWVRGREQQGPLYVVSLHAKRVRALLNRRGVDNATVVDGILSEGFGCQQLADVITDRELFGTTRRPRYEIKETGSGQDEFREGDLVVHAERGIGRFVGLVPIDLEGARRDLFKLEYANEHTLMVPPEQIDQLSLYRGGDDEEPALSRLDTGAWQKVLEKARTSVLETAASFERLQKQKARRRAAPIGPDTPEQDELEAAFPYDETPSQLAAIAEIKGDMERAVAMDRLLCGDVGYGKTEVALRAAFKAVASGFQAAMLAPTTVLAQQHFESFRARLEPQGVRVAGLWGNSESPAEVVAGLADGTVQMVVGTHRLLSHDVSFSKLGLLVVDEEQQFGVRHKESLRQLAKGVHVLSMSATPIPRTMQLALAGVRDISLLETPPEARRPIRTYLLTEESKLMAAALMRELERDGQVFVLHNNVGELPSLAKRLSRLVKRARVAVGHGQMEKGELERVLQEFEAREHDVLVCSTIIEAGIDFPNVNSMVVKDAHMFGLAQLYQIRGRVGRSGRQAYCYLMVPSLKTLADKARQRLETVRQLSELGAGYRIALRDLEIRGAGDLLGGDQSGQIARVGYTLYSRMLEEALKGEVRAQEENRCAVEFPLDAHIPTEYIWHASARIALYRRLSEIRSSAHLERLSDELTDRYGTPPEPVLCLLEVSRLRMLAAKRNIRGVRTEEKFGELSVLCLGDGERTEFAFDGAPKGPKLLGFVIQALNKRGTAAS